MVHNYHAKQQHQNMNDSLYNKHFTAGYKNKFALLVLIRINFLDIFEQ